MSYPFTDTSAMQHPSPSPVITRMQVIPVAGHDGMLLNLSGAHGPFFTRNIVILTDSIGPHRSGRSARWRKNPPDPRRRPPLG
jgi:hypothetical protein